MILWFHGDEKQATHSTKCALSFEPGSSELAMLSVSLSHSVGQCGPQLLVSHTIRKGDRSGRNDTQPAHRSRGSGPHETASLWELWQWTSVCHLRFLVTTAVLAPRQKLFVRKKKNKRNTKWIHLTHLNSTVLSGEDAGAQRPPVPYRQDNLIFQK